MQSADQRPAAQKKSEGEVNIESVMACPEGSGIFQLPPEASQLGLQEQQQAESHSRARDAQREILKSNFDKTP